MMFATIIERGRNLLVSKSKDAASIRRTIGEISEEIERADSARRSLVASYAEKLAVATDRDEAALDADITAAERKLVRLNAVRDELQKLAGEAEAAERQAEIDRLRRDAEEKTRAEEKAIRDLYPKAAAMLLDLMRSQAIGAQAREIFNAAVPEEDRMLSPERAVRGFVSLSREVLSRSQVRLWCHADSWDVIPENLQGKVTPTGEGTGQTPPTQHNSGYPVELRSFERVEYHPADHQTFEALATLSLPGFFSGEPPVWTPSMQRLSNAELIDAIDRRRSSKRAAARDREVVVEHVPIKVSAKASDPVADESESEPALAG